ncbi:MAG: LemA family protein [Spirochaetaceae bacterium]|jgi:LemA protein|nr:LemA family protein [Spirochaetaceae bacterium]
MVKKILPIVTGIAALALIVIGFYVGTRNSLIRLDESTGAAWSEIDNQLQRRADLIPNFVNTVKGYAAHEEQLFSEIAQARARLAGGGTVEEKAAGYNAMESALSRLLMVVENYPDLKASANFTALQDELAGTENRIAVARNRYNDSVRQFNTRIRTFPGSLFAGGLGFSSRPYFEIQERARDVPAVEF